MTEQKLKGILESLTLEQKVGQLVQLSADFFSLGSQGVVTGPAQQIGLKEDYNIYNTGSILNVLDAKLLYAIQTQYLKNNTHGIPLLFCGDIIYGYSTIFPIPIAQGCSWNYPKIEEAAAISADEMVKGGIHATFSPMLDLVRDPRWGRVMESPGEEPLILSRYAGSMVKGLQGAGSTGTIPKNKAAACVKHFAAYGAPEGGREYAAVDMSLAKLYGEYLTGYIKAIKAGARLVMTAFNTLNGEPCTGSSWLNRQVLREECGFDGVLISDYAAIVELVKHGVAKDAKDAARLAMLAGVDIDMMTACYANYMPQLVVEGAIDVALVDEAVYRVLTLKNSLGLFEDPYRGLGQAKAATRQLSPKSKQAALHLAEESAVLLKNNNATLPIAAGSRIALIGPYAKSQDTIGMWAISGDCNNTRTLYQGLAAVVGEENICYALGCAVVDSPHELGIGADELAEFPCAQGVADAELVGAVSAQSMIDEAVAAAHKADVVVLAIGEHTLQSGEGASRTGLGLADVQKNLLLAIAAVKKPVVMVVYSGRPLVIPKELELADAVLYAWYLGNMSGEAIANLLCGKANPSGRLSMSVPRSEGQIPVYSSMLPTGRPHVEGGVNSRFSSHYLDTENSPEFPLGFGLSYTEFSYLAAEVDSKVLAEGVTITLTVQVKNHGRMQGAEVVQVYLEAPAGVVSRPKRKLVDFEKITIAPGEIGSASFNITYDMVKYCTWRGRCAVQCGRHILHISSDAQSSILQVEIDVE